MKNYFLHFLMLAFFSNAAFAQKRSEAEMKKQEAFIEAVGFRMNGKLAKAEEALQRIVLDFPKNSAAWFELSRTFLAKKETAKALDACRKAIELEPENEWFQLFEADLFEQLGRARDAAASLERLTKRFPKNADFLEKWAYLLTLSEQPEAALKALEKREKLVGPNEEVFLKKHIILAAMGDDKKAAGELEKLVAAFPDEPKHRLALAQFLERTGQKERARAVYQDILKRNPDDVAAKLAILEKTGGSKNDKMAVLKTLFADSKKPIDVKIGELIPFLQQVEKAPSSPETVEILELGKILTVAHADEPKAFAIAGDLFYLAQKNDEAAAFYEKCIALRGNVFSVWENSMTIKKEQKKWPELAAEAERAMDFFPNQARVWLFRGIALTEMGRFDDATTELQQAVLMAGNNLALKSDAFDCLGAAFYRKKEFAKALDTFETGFKKCGDINPFLLEHLGDALFQAGKTDDALLFWKKAKEKGLKSSRLDRKIAERKLIEQ